MPRLAWALALAAVAGLCGVARASVLLWDTFPAATGIPALHATGPSAASGWPADVDVAARFTTGSSGVVLASVELPVAAMAGNAADVALMTDLGGLPGVLLATATLTAIPPFSSPFTFTTFSGPFTGATSLTPNTNYWIGISATGTTDIGWEIVSPANPAAWHPCVRTGGGAWSLQGSASPGALRVYVDAPVQATSRTWGRVKALFR